jgi:hypothetical protein
MQEKYIKQIQLGIKCTNSYSSSKETINRLEESTTIIENQSSALLFIEKKRYDFWRLYFYIQDISKINWAIFEEKVIVAEIIVRHSKKEEWDPIIQTFQEKGKFKIYDTFIRLCKDKIDIDLQDVDFSLIESPIEEDFQEIQRLLEANFDIYSDRLHSVEELKELRKTTFLIRDKGQIVAFFVAEKNGFTLINRYWLVLESHRGRRYGDVLMKRILTCDPEIKRVTSWISQKLNYSIQAHKYFGFKEDGLTNYILYREK